MREYMKRKIPYGMEFYIFEEYMKRKLPSQLEFYTSLHTQLMDYSTNHTYLAVSN